MMGATNKLKKYLKPDAVPSVFDFPPHLEKKLTHENVQWREKQPLPMQSQMFPTRNLKGTFSQLDVTTSTAHLLVGLFQK
jgi:hypothetical protein